MRPCGRREERALVICQQHPVAMTPLWTPGCTGTLAKSPETRSAATATATFHCAHCGHEVDSRLRVKTSSARGRRESTTRASDGL